MTLADELRIVLDGQWRNVREQSRLELASMDLLDDPSLSLDEARDRGLEQMKALIPTGIPAAGFTKAQETALESWSNANGVFRFIRLRVDQAGDYWNDILGSGTIAIYQPIDPQKVDLRLIAVPAAK